MWVEGYDRVANRDRDPAAQLVEILKYRSAVRLIGALDSLDDNSARGLVAFWYSFLEPPASQRQIPSLQQVLRYAASHTADLSQTVAALLKRSQRFQQNVRVQTVLNASLLSQKLQNLFREMRGPDDKVVEKVPASTRRSWANYLSSTINTLAHEIFVMAPEVFVTGEEKLITKGSNDRGDQSASLPAQAEPCLLELTVSPSESDDNKTDQLAFVPARLPPRELEKLALDLLDKRARLHEDDGEGDDGQEFRTSSMSDTDWVRKWLMVRLDELASYTMDVCSHHDFAFGIELPIQIQIERHLILENIGEIAKIASGKHIPDPLKGRVALLSAHPGTGRTSQLRSWGYQSAFDWLTVTTTTIPFYIDARKFRDYIVNDFNIYRCITDYVFPRLTLEESGILRRVLEALDRTDHLLIIVDDLDRLTQADQSKIMDRLLFSRSVVYATIPSDAVWIRSKLPEYKNPISITFKDLDKSAQEELLSKVSFWYLERDCDWTLGQYVLQEIPYLCESPLGVLSVYSQLVKHQTTRSGVVDNYLQETLRRAGLPACNFAQGWYSPDPIVGSLLRMARAIAAKLRLWDSRQNEPLVFGAGIDDFERILSSIYWSTSWNLLLPTRLFTIWGEASSGMVSFCNNDVLCYLAAIDTYYDFRNKDEKHPFVASLDQRMLAYYDEDWEKNGEKDHR